jgi:hypothetical protein
VARIFGYQPDGLSADIWDMRLLAVFSIVGGFAIYLISIAALESPLLLGLSVPMIIAGAAALALIGGQSTPGIEPPPTTHTLFVPLPVDDLPVLAEIDLENDQTTLDPSEYELVIVGEAAGNGEWPPDSAIHF